MTFAGSVSSLQPHRQNWPREHCGQCNFCTPTRPPGHLHHFYSLSIVDHPFTLICDITWENGEHYIKPRFKFVFTVERKLKEFLSWQKSRSGSFLAGGIRPAALF